MENEENRGLINKKSFEDQFVPFCLFSFGTLSLFSLSHSWTHRFFLEHSSFGARKEKKAKWKEGKKGSSKEEPYEATLVGILAGNILPV